MNINVDESNLMERIKSRYGLVPAKDETFEEFLSRSKDTIEKKENPRENWILKEISKDRPVFEKLDYVKELAKKHFRISDPIIDAFSMNIPKKIGAKGFAYGEKDGSSVVVINENNKNMESIVRNTRMDLESMINGENIEIMEHENRGVLWRDTSYTSTDNLDILSWNLYVQYMKSPYHIGLHELVHALHINNHDTGRRGSKYYEKEKLILRKIPILGHFFKSKDFSFTVETESLAFKVAFDEMTQEVLDRTYANQNYPIPKEELRKEIRDRHSKLSRSIIKLGYLGDRSKGYRTPMQNYSSLLINSAMSYYFMDSPSLISQSIGAFFMYRAANSALRLPFSMYFSSKIHSTMNTLDKLVDKVGDAGDSFFHTLGMDMKEIKKAID